MANGALGKEKPAAATEEILYSCPADTVASVTVSGSNQGSSINKMRVAHITGTLVGDLDSADYIMYERAIGPEEDFERTSMVLKADESILIRSDLGDVNFIAQGYEEPA